MIDVRLKTTGRKTATGFARKGSSAGAKAVDSTEAILSWIRTWLVPVDEDGNEVEKGSGIEIHALKAKYPFYSVGEISAFGFQEGEGAPAVGIDEETLAEYLKPYAKKSDIPSAPDLSPYAKKSDIPSLDGYLKSADAATLYQPKGSYLTSHQPLHTLTVQKNGVQVGTFKPNANATINISDVASASTLSTHTSDTTLHITAAERTAWNGKVDAVSGKGLSTNDFTTALLNKLNGIAEGANNYTHPTGGANSTIAAANGKVLSSITVNTLGHVTAVGSKTLVSDDIPSLAISKITNLQTSLDAKLNASVFNELFEKTTVSGKTVIKAKFSLYSADELSALGYGSSGSTGTEQTAVGINKSELAEWLTQNGYATQSWVNGKGFIVKGSSSTQALMENGGTRTVNLMSSVTNLGWATTSGQIATINTLAYWNGQYSSGSSNLQYCDRGRFGTMAVETASHYAKLWAPNNLIHNDNEFTFIPGGFAHASLWFNYRAGDGTTNATQLQEYHFGNGTKEGRASLVAAGYKISGGTANQLLAADGSTQSLYKAAEVTTATADSGTITPYAMNQWTGKTYLKLTGGTIKNGSAVTPLQIDTDATNEVGIILRKSGAYKAWVGHDSLGARVWNAVCARGIGVNDAGIPKFQSSTIWHEDNDGSGSGLDADLLDGKHASDFVQDAGRGIEGKIYSIPTKRVFSGYNVPDAPVQGWISGLVLGSNWNDNHYQHYLVESGGRWYATREYENNAMKNWKTFAYLTDNVASASKLATTRTIWGQDFNGEGNVSGDMSLGANYAIIGGNAAPILKDHGNSNVTVNASGNDLFIGYTTTKNLRFYTGDATNLGSLKMMILQNGNVGIGIEIPTHKLHVNGDIKAENGVTAVSLVSRYHYFKDSAQTTGLFFDTGANGSLSLSTWKDSLNWNETVAVFEQNRNANFYGMVKANNGLEVVGNTTIYGPLNLGNKDNNSSIEIFHATPYIDFHFGRSTADYTSRIIEYASGCVRLEGNFYSTGEVTALTTSDQRLKTNIRPLTEAVRRLKALGGYRVYDYLPEANARVSTARIGLIAQNVQGNVGAGMLNTRPDGYLSLNYLHPDYINLIGAATLENADELTKAKRRIKQLEKRVAELEAS